MKISPIPVIFEPLYKPKPWGGRMLATLFGKSLPPDEPIGESWELVSLPDNESRVKDGPLAGQTISELVQRWGPGLFGEADPGEEHFPLLIKFLDAREDLSVQVHPKPPVDDPDGWCPGLKHEAWYVLDADPGAQIYIGLKPGVTLAELARVANSPGTAGLLRSWPARPGDCFYLPSGTIHALGAGLVVAEIQTPSDVTYRLYDWDRLGRDGLPRELHVDQALRNVRLDVAETQIIQPRRAIPHTFATATRTTSCERFQIDWLQLPAGLNQPISFRRMVLWIILDGRGTFHRNGPLCSFRPGDVVLIPAACDGTHIKAVEGCELLEVGVPTGVSTTNNQK